MSFATVRRGESPTQGGWWDAGSAGEVENLLVSSQIPTLVLAGGFDPGHPSSMG